MPEVNLTVKWPDNEIQEVYSPSTIVYDYFKEGDTMTVESFVSKSTEALGKASDRVAAKYGFACTSAMHSLQSVQQKARNLSTKDQIEIIAID